MTSSIRQVTGECSTHHSRILVQLNYRFEAMANMIIANACAELTK